MQAAFFYSLCAQTELQQQKVIKRTRVRVREGLITCLTKQENIFSFLCSVAAIALALRLNFLVGWVVTPAISGIHYWCAGRMGSGCGVRGAELRRHTALGHAASRWDALLWWVEKH